MAPLKQTPELSILDNDKCLEIAPEEFMGFDHALKNSGLYPKSFYQIQTNWSYYNNSWWYIHPQNDRIPVQLKWWYFIYKIPRRW